MHERVKAVAVLGFAVALGTAAVAVAAEPEALATRSTPLAELDLDESFEASVPPVDWTWQGTNTGSDTWYQLAPKGPLDGFWCAAVEYDPDLLEQDEWLISPRLSLTEQGTLLTFWSGGSVYWCRDTFDNCHLEVWLVLDELDHGAAGGDDIFLGRAEDDWAQSWVWCPSSFDLSPYLPVTARIGLRYWGIDGAQVVVDLVRVGLDAPLVFENGLESRSHGCLSSGAGGPKYPLEVMQDVDAIIIAPALTVVGGSAPSRERSRSSSVIR